MNGFSANKTTVLLDFRPLRSHTACCKFQSALVFGPVAHSEGSWQVLKDLLVRYRLGGSNDCLSEEMTGSSLKSKNPVRTLLIISVKLECSNWVRHLSQH